MEDIFYIPSKKILLKDLEVLILKYYPDALFSYSEVLYVSLSYHNTYWEFYNLKTDELNGLQLDEPDFWDLIKPKQVITITHKRSFYNILKPVLREILCTIGGSICIDFDELFDLYTLDEFNY